LKFTYEAKECYKKSLDGIKKYMPDDTEEIKALLIRSIPVIP